MLTYKQYGITHKQYKRLCAWLQWVYREQTSKPSLILRLVVKDCLLGGTYLEVRSAFGIPEDGDLYASFRTDFSVATVEHARLDVSRLAARTDAYDT